MEDAAQAAHYFDKVCQGALSNSHTQEEEAALSDTGMLSSQPTHDSDTNKVGLDLFVGIYRTQNIERHQMMFGRHLAWATEQEAAGRIFLTGPLTSHNNEEVNSGLTVFRAASEDDAHALARTDPFVIEGVNSVRIMSWEVLGGSMNIALKISDRSVAIR